MKATKFSRQPKSFRDILKKILRSYDFLKNMNQYHTYILERCKECLAVLISDNVTDFAIYGAGAPAEVLYELTLGASVRINAVYDNIHRDSFFNFSVMPLEQISEYKGKVVVTGMVGINNSIEVLQNMGVDKERIVVL